MPTALQKRPDLLASIHSYVCVSMSWDHHHEPGCLQADMDLCVDEHCEGHVVGVPCLNMYRMMCAAVCSSAHGSVYADVIMCVQQEAQ